MSRGNKVHTKNAVGIVVQLHPSAQFVTNNLLCALFGTKPYLCFLSRTHTSGRLELPLTPWGLSQKCPQHLGVFPRVMNLLACLPECPVQCGTHCTVGIYTWCLRSWNFLRNNSVGGSHLQWTRIINLLACLFDCLPVCPTVMWYWKCIRNRQACSCITLPCLWQITLMTNNTICYFRPF